LRRIRDSRVEVIAGNGCRLPFKDNSFDIVSSVDCLEHIPASKKVDFCSEIKRIAKKYVIIHCPADSLNGTFQGTIYDTRFLQWYRHRFKKDEPNTVEHLNSELPKIEELNKLFPDATIIGKQNCNVWLRYLKWCFTPYIRFFAGLIYKVSLMQKDNLPPYHACLLIWEKKKSDG